MLSRSAIESDTTKSRLLFSAASLSDGVGQSLEDSARSNSLHAESPSVKGESIDTLDRQPLVSSGSSSTLSASGGSANNNNNNNKDEEDEDNISRDDSSDSLDSTGSHETGAKFRRKSVELSDPLAASTSSANGSKSLTSTNLVGQKSQADEEASNSSSEAIGSNNEEQSTIQASTMPDSGISNPTKIAVTSSSTTKRMPLDSIILSATNDNDDVSSDFPSSFPMDPILNQFFNDLPLPFAGNMMLKPTILSGGEASPISKLFESSLPFAENGKMVIKRNKNGATIIIASSNLMNDSNPTNGSRVSSSPSLPLLEKLLPPILRPLTLFSSPRGHPLTNLTADMNSNQTEPTTNRFTFNGPESLNLVVAGSSMIPSTSMGLFPRFTHELSASPMERLFTSSFMPFRFNQQPRRSLFMEPMGYPRPALSSIFTSGPSPFSMSPAAGFLNMLTRASMSAPEADDDAETSSEVELKNVTVSDLTANKTGIANSTSINLRSQSLKENEDEGPMESGMISTKHPSPLNVLLKSRASPMTTGAGSMLIMSSMSNLGDHMGPVGLPPFFMPPAQMVMMGDSEASNSGPLNPVLRSILDEVMSNFMSDVGKNKSSLNQQRRSSGQIASSDSDDEPAESEISDRWDELPIARHRQDEDSDASDDVLDFMNHENHQLGSLGFMMEPRGPMEPKILSGSIKTTFKSPDVFPTGRVLGMEQQVPKAHYQPNRANNHRSDSMDESDTSNYRLSKDDIDVPSHIGIINKLLSSVRKQERVSPSDTKIMKHRSDEPRVTDFEIPDEDKFRPKARLHIKGPKIRISKAKVAPGLLGPKMTESLNSPGDIDRNDANRRIEWLDNQPSLEQGMNNPFTSPSSPLFGFPSPIAPSNLSQNRQMTGSGSRVHANRQPRAFSYHSNNEVAAPFVRVRNDVKVYDTKRDEIVGSSSILQPRFAEPPKFHPAAIVMGRRLDDGPSFITPNQN